MMGGNAFIREVMRERVGGRGRLKSSLVTSQIHPGVVSHQTLSNGGLLGPKADPLRSFRAKRGLYRESCI